MSVKTEKLNKKAALAAAISLLCSISFAANSQNARNASVKKDSDIAVSMSQTDVERNQSVGGNPRVGQAKAESEDGERVSEADADPRSAEIDENLQYKERTGKIGDTDIIDAEGLPQAVDEEPKVAEAERRNQETEEKSVQKSANVEYSGNYEGSIRSAHPKVEVSDSESENRQEPEETAEIPEIAEEGGIDVTGAIAFPTTDEAEEPETPEIVPSRSVAMKNGQYLEVTYPGRGWAFLGDDTSKERLSFMGRRLSREDTTFTLRSKKGGTTLLHFYKNDALTGQYIDDWLEVQISEEMAADTEKNERVRAPLYAEYVPPRPNRTRVDEDAVQADSAVAQANDSAKVATAQNPAGGNGNSEGARSADATSASASRATEDDRVRTNIQTAAQEQGNARNASANAVASNSAGLPSNVMGTNVEETADGDVAADAGTLYERAKKAFDEKRFEEALELAQKCLDSDAESADKILYLLGQIWEADSKARNIKSSIDSYDALVKNYPTSSLWRQANMRLVYLRRSFVDIR